MGIVHYKAGSSQLVHNKCQIYEAVKFETKSVNKSRREIRQVVLQYLLLDWQKIGTRKKYGSDRRIGVSEYVANYMLEANQGFH